MTSTNESSGEKEAIRKVYRDLLKQAEKHTKGENLVLVIENGKAFAKTSISEEIVARYDGQLPKGLSNSTAYAQPTKTPGKFQLLRPISRESPLTKDSIKDPETVASWKKASDQLLMKRVDKRYQFQPGETLSNKIGEIVKDETIKELLKNQDLKLRINSGTLEIYGARLESQKPLLIKRNFAPKRSPDITFQVKSRGERIFSDKLGDKKRATNISVQLEPESKARLAQAELGQIRHTDNHGFYQKLDQALNTEFDALKFGAKKGRFDFKLGSRAAYQQYRKDEIHSDLVDYVITFEKTFRDSPQFRKEVFNRPVEPLKEASVKSIASKAIKDFIEKTKHLVTKVKEVFDLVINRDVVHSEKMNQMLESRVADFNTRFAVKKPPVQQKTPPQQQSPVQQKTPPQQQPPVQQKTPPQQQSPVQQKTPPQQQPPVQQKTPPQQQQQQPHHQVKAVVGQMPGNRSLKEYVEEHYKNAVGLNGNGSQSPNQRGVLIKSTPSKATPNNEKSSQNQQNQASNEDNQNSNEQQKDPKQKERKRGGREL